MSGHVYLKSSLYSSPDLIGLSPKAFWTWLQGITWLTGNRDAEGVIPANVADQLGSKREHRELVARGLWVDATLGYESPRAPRGVALWKPGAVGNTRPAIPDALRRAVYERDGHACLVCGSTDDLTLDHIVHWSKGGQDTLGNLRTLCRPCNSSRGDRTDAEWLGVAA